MELSLLVAERFAAASSDAERFVDEVSVAERFVERFAAELAVAEVASLSVWALPLGMHRELVGVDCCSIVGLAPSTHAQPSPSARRARAPACHASLAHVTPVDSAPERDGFNDCCGDLRVHPPPTTTGTDTGTGAGTDMGTAAAGAGAGGGCSGASKSSSSELHVEAVRAACMRDASSSWLGRCRSSTHASNRHLAFGRARFESAMP